METETKQGNYITGILGALVGGLIAAAPWVIAYVYGGIMLSILAVLITAGAFIGYKICKGKIDKKLPILLMIVSLVIVTIATLLIIPALLLQNEGVSPNLTLITRLYSNSEFSTAMIKDYIISIVFTLLGAGIVTANIKKQLNQENGQDIKLDLNNNEEIIKTKKEAIELIKPIFEKYEATKKETTMMKEEVLAELEDNDKAKNTFKFLSKCGIIKKYKGKYYYSEENEAKEIKPKKISALGITGIITVLAVLAVVGIVIANMSKLNSKETYQDGTISFEITSDWINYEAQYTTEWDFYKYINSFPADAEYTNSVDKQNYSEIYPATIDVYYNAVDTSTISNIEDLKTNLDQAFEDAEQKPEKLATNISKTSQNYDLVTAKMIYENSPEEIIYYYYILNENSLCCVTVHSFNLDDEKNIEKEGQQLVNSIKWLK